MISVKPMEQFVRILTYGASSAALACMSYFFILMVKHGGVILVEPNPIILAVEVVVTPLLLLSSIWIFAKDIYKWKRRQEVNR